MMIDRFRSVASHFFAWLGVVLLFIAVVIMPLEESYAQTGGTGAGCTQPACGSACQGTCNGQSAPCDGNECTMCEDNTLGTCPGCSCEGRTACGCFNGLPS